MHEALAIRERERERLIGLARLYVEELGERMSVRAAAVVGSVARGDFNVWSDVDVVLIADALPSRVPDRGRALSERAPPRVQSVGFTPDEFQAAWRGGNPLAREATAAGVQLSGGPYLDRLGPAAVKPPRPR